MIFHDAQKDTMISYILQESHFRLQIFFCDLDDSQDNLTVNLMIYISTNDKVVNYTNPCSVNKEGDFLAPLSRHHYGYLKI